MSGSLEPTTVAMAASSHSGSGPARRTPKPPPSPRPPLVRWELMLPTGAPVPANLGGFYEAFGTDDDGLTTLWVLLPAFGDREGYDPRLPAPAYVVDTFLEPTPPLRSGDVDGDRRWRYRLDADGDLVRVLDEPWDPASDPVYGPAIREYEQGN
jgi:hypothetical protein